jgi:Transposase DDE domain
VIAGRCFTHAADRGGLSLLLYDVTTLYFEAENEDDLRKVGYSNYAERRLEPQITIGLLTDAAGFPLAVEAFGGNKAETATMLPVINAFKAAHQLTDVTVVADAGIISEANQLALQASGLSFILGTRIPFAPDVVREWRDTHPDEAIPDGQVFTQPWPTTISQKARGIPDRVVYYQHRYDRPRRTVRGIDEQVAKPQRAVDGHAPVKRNRFIKLTGAAKSGFTPSSTGRAARTTCGSTRSYGWPRNGTPTTSSTTETSTATSVLTRRHRKIGPRRRDFTGRWPRPWRSILRWRSAASN